MVVLQVTVQQRYRPDPHRQKDHKIFERDIIYNIDPKQRQAGKHKRQHSTVYSAG